MDMNVQEIPLSAIKVADNVRFGLKKTRIESLAASIAEKGLLSPLVVEPLNPPENGFEYKLAMGNYRFAAITQLNSTGAGILTVPASIVPAASAADRIKLQLTENNERENMSPMDKGVAIKALFDANVPRPEIRGLFSTPGGRKGTLKNQAASNAHINMMMSFLDFPKAIQEKIHDGRITTGFAYELHRRPKEQWETVLADAEAFRVKGIDQEEKDEAKYLEAEKKAAESEQKVKEVETELDAANTKLAEASAKADEAAETEVKALKAARAGASNDEDKAKKAADLKAAMEAAKLSIKEAEAAKALAAKLEAKRIAARAIMDEKYRRLQDARAKAQKKGAKVGTGDLKKSEDKKDKPEGALPLNSTQMREVINTWCLPGSFPKVQAIALLIKNVFDGLPGCLTDKQALSRIAVITGEKMETKGVKPKA